VAVTRLEWRHRAPVALPAHSYMGTSAQVHVLPLQPHRLADAQPGLSRQSDAEPAVYARRVASIFFAASEGEHPLVLHVSDDLQDVLDAVVAGQKLVTVTETSSGHKVLVNPETIAFVRA